MNLKVIGLFAAIVLLSAVVVETLSSDAAAATKAIKKSPSHSYSKWNKNQVCGDKLCDGKSFMTTKTKISVRSPSR